MGELRVLIVDDEPLVRDGIRALLAHEADVRIVGESRNGVEALEHIRGLAPALVFLDVQMPGMDGLQVIAELDESERPAIVFVTAYDEYAIRAFDVHAVDYLLKPFDAERFAVAMERARSRLAAGRDDRIAELLAGLRQDRKYADRLLLKHEGSVVVVLVDDIDWIEAADNYVKLHTRTGRLLVREPLKSIEERLDPARFARANRSAVVNLARVTSLEPVTTGEYVIRLTTGARVTLSRGYRDELRLRLQGRR